MLAPVSADIFSQSINYFALSITVQLKTHRLHLESTRNKTTVRTEASLVHTVHNTRGKPRHSLDTSIQVPVETEKLKSSMLSSLT